MRLRHNITGGICFLLLTLILGISVSATSASRQPMIRPTAITTAPYHTNPSVKAASHDHPPDDGPVERYLSTETEREKQVAAGATLAAAMEEHPPSASLVQASAGLSKAASMFNRPSQMTNHDQSSRLRRNYSPSSSSRTAAKKRLIVKRRRRGSSRNHINRFLVDQIDYPSARTHPPTEPP